MVPFTLECVEHCSTSRSMRPIIMSIQYVSFIDRREGVFVGSGAKLRASMVLFQQPDYTKPYAAGAVVLELGSPLYVGVSVDKKDPSLVVVLEDCFASHSSDPDSTLERDPLISNKCPTDDEEVFAVQSGSSLQAHFSFRFHLIEEYKDVFVHCSLSLCDRRSNACNPGESTAHCLQVSTQATNHWTNHLGETICVTSVPLLTDVPIRGLQPVSGESLTKECQSDTMPAFQNK
ncbi:uromodulin-like [Dunckerocampus dactyliophorus]|uniref:uromodulin-like n=1 Tax=Dunckerocampus dactyliophorus TaxID=161453 RepID=UPI002404CF6D|nr:uromodulin-like [Dunckerocampus dactyliophorus]